MFKSLSSTPCDYNFGLSAAVLFSSDDDGRFDHSANLREDQTRFSSATVRQHARVVSDEVAPFVWVNDEPEWDDDLEDIDISAMPILPPKASFAVTVEIERTVRPPVLPLEIDEVDLELFDL